MGGNITAINIKMGSNGNYIASIRIRYGATWTPWRHCSDFADGQEKMLELEPSSGEAISSLNGYSEDSNGWTRSLEASTTAGRSWGPHGDHISSYSLHKSPNAKLHFLSGDQTRDNWILRFHWEPDLPNPL